MWVLSFNSSLAAKLTHMYDKIIIIKYIVFNMPHECSVCVIAPDFWIFYCWLLRDWFLLLLLLLLMLFQFAACVLSLHGHDILIHTHVISLFQLAHTYTPNDTGNGNARIFYHNSYFICHKKYYYLRSWHFKSITWRRRRNKVECQAERRKVRERGGEREKGE